MCGIVGLVCKECLLVDSLFKMLKRLQHRGTDSSGIAFYRNMSLKPKEYLFVLNTMDIPGSDAKVTSAIEKVKGNIRDIHHRFYAGFGVDDFIISLEKENLEDLVQEIKKTERARVLSFGKGMTILKEVGSVDKLENIYRETFLVRDREIKITHGIGNVRFSTESVVNKYHAHPFQANFSDIAVVHNGQITNYWKIRDKLEIKNHIFESQNDTEVIIHYVVDKLNEGNSLEESLKQSVEDLDGPFAYMISTPSAIGMAVDKLGLRPLVVAEDENMMATASEESALREVIQNPSIHYMSPGDVKVLEL